MAHYCARSASVRPRQVRIPSLLSLSHCHGRQPAGKRRWLKKRSYFSNLVQSLNLALIACLVTNKKILKNKYKAKLKIWESRNSNFLLSGFTTNCLKNSHNTFSSALFLFISRSRYTKLWFKLFFFLFHAYPRLVISFWQSISCEISFCYEVISTIFFKSNRNKDKNDEKFQFSVSVDSLWQLARKFRFRKKSARSWLCSRKKFSHQARRYFYFWKLDIKQNRKSKGSKEN